MSGQSSMALSEAGADPVDVALLLVPDLMTLREAPRMRMPSDLISFCQPLPPELGECIHKEGAISQERGNLIVGSQQPRETNLSSHAVLEAPKELKHSGYAFSQPSPFELT